MSRWHRQGRHWLIPARAGLKGDVVCTYGPDRTRAYAEIKTDMLRQAMTLRSQHPEGVEQELWATLLMYNLIRL